MAQPETYNPLAGSATDEGVALPKVNSTPWVTGPRALTESGRASIGSETADYGTPRAVPQLPSAEKARSRRERLIPLQSWEAVVLSVDESSFVIRATDVSGEHADEEVVFPTEELSEFDLDLLEPGAIVYWTIGYREKAGGARERISQMRLRRLPAWSKAQLDEAEARATALARDLGW